MGPAGRKGSQDVSYAYTTAPWHDFFVCAGGSAAALLGLLFVALSFHLDRVAGHQIWRSRVWAATMELLTALVIALAVLIPGQPARALGLEALLWVVPISALAVHRQRQYLRGVHLPRSARLTRLGANAAAITTLAGGISLLIGRFGGLYWLAATTLLCLVYGVTLGWHLTFQIVEQDSIAETDAERTSVP